nr:hypothetical protein Iba_chr11aCG14300 [Ipomoea batatas]
MRIGRSRSLKLLAPFDRNSQPHFCAPPLASLANNYCSYQIKGLISLTISTSNSKAWLIFDLPRMRIGRSRSLKLLAPFDRNSQPHFCAPPLASLANIFGDLIASMFLDENYVAQPKSMKDEIRDRGAWTKNRIDGIPCLSCGLSFQNG